VGVPYLVAFDFNQGPILQKMTSNRINWFSFLAAFGGFLSLTRVISNFMVKDVQGFSIDNSIIKKLYSLKYENGQ
jgi:hypothetical protein